MIPGMIYLVYDMYSRERSYEYVNEQVSHHDMFVLDTGCWRDSL